MCENSEKAKAMAVYLFDAYAGYHQKVIKKWATSNKSSILLKIDLLNTQISQLNKKIFTKNGELRL